MINNSKGFLRLMSLHRVFLFAFLLFQGTLVSVASDPAMQWMQKMSMAMQELSYQGRFVYLHDSQLESMSILHVNDDQGKRERLVSLNGEAREILRDNQSLTCVWPSSKQVVVDPSNQSDSSPLWIPDDVKRLAKFYQFKMVGEDRVADHDAIVISIMPKDEYRYGMKVWLDKTNAMLLRSSVLDTQGKVVEQVMFTELTVLPASQLKHIAVLPEIDNSYALIRSHQGTVEKRRPADNRWQLSFVPAGFWLESSFSKRMGDTEGYTQQMIYTDGMASVSIFIERNDGEKLAGNSSMGAVNAYGASYQDYSITAIGEVPSVTVRKMATSVALNEH